MTATIKWSIVASGTPLDVGAPSAFIDTLTKVFGDFPLELDAADLDKLDVIARIYADESRRTAFDELIDIIKLSGAIELWAEY